VRGAKEALGVLWGGAGLWGGLIGVRLCIPGNAYMYDICMCAARGAELGGGLIGVLLRE
jgi:hypothetical protein